jgi:hypothetical protein
LLQPTKEKSDAHITIAPVQAKRFGSVIMIYPVKSEGNFNE